MLNPDTRPGYSGWLVDKSHLLEFATALRDEFGYDYLSSVTGVDYLPEGKMEVVYQVYRTTGGPGLMFKVQVPRDRPGGSSIAGSHLSRCRIPGARSLGPARHQIHRPS